MHQLELFNIPSPCRRVCESNSRGLCIRCFRNRDERLNWLQFTAEEKRLILKKCSNRKILDLREKRQLQKAAADKAAAQGDFFGMTNG